MSFAIFQKGKTPFQALKIRSSKSRKIDIFSKGLTHGFGPNIVSFPTFFLSNIGQENVFYNLLEQKNVFLAYKKKKFKIRKIDIFSKGLTHGFCQKMAIFRFLFFRHYRQGKCDFNILEQKNAFLPYKNNTFKKSNN